MRSKKDNAPINNFFRKEYQVLRDYVRSKLDETVETDAEDIIQSVAVRIFSWPSAA